MEATAFPVRTARGALMLGGRHTEVVVSRYTDKLVVIATQLPTVGTMMHVSLGAQPSNRSAAPSAVRMQVGHLADDDEDADDVETAQQGAGGSVLADEPTVLLGRRDMPMLSALCRALATRLMLTAAANQEGVSGLPPSMLLCLGLHASGDGEDDEEVKQQLLPLLERTVHAVLDM